MATTLEKIQARRKEIRDILGEELSLFTETIATEIREDLILVVIEVLRQLQLIPAEGEEPRVGEPLPATATFIQALPFERHKFVTRPITTTADKVDILQDLQFADVKFVIVEPTSATQIDFDNEITGETPVRLADTAFGVPIAARVIHFQGAAAGTLKIFIFG